MILADTGGLYALADRRDAHHASAVAFVSNLQAGETLAISALIAGECATLMEGRLGMKAARRFWSDVAGGAFHMLAVDTALIAEALEIDGRYQDVEMGLVDCSTFALCERHRLDRVFTFDHRHFGLYKPTFVSHLTLVP